MNDKAFPVNRPVGVAFCRQPEQVYTDIVGGNLIQWFIDRLEEVVKVALVRPQ